ncbi:MAG: hypothetical protein KC766_37375 [Myxococcales bacterium]|nr:hypothetical protein [Myxococcales bacterium]
MARMRSPTDSLDWRLIAVAAEAVLQAQASPGHRAVLCAGVPMCISPEMHRQLNATRAAVGSSIDDFTAGPLLVRRKAESASDYLTRAAQHLPANMVDPIRVLSEQPEMWAVEQ